MADIRELALRPVGRLLWQYSLPSIVGMTVVSSYNVIDRIFIGQKVGPDAIAGLAITFPVMNLVTALGVLVGAGASARVSVLLGQQRKDDAQQVLGNALILTLLIGICYVSVFSFFLDDILRAFGASARTLPPAHAFLSTLMPGMMLMNLTFSFNNIQRASGYPRRAMMAMLLSALINLALAPLFLFVFEMGIRGAALATLLSMVCAFVFVFAHFLNRKSTLHFVRGIYRLRRQTVLPILAIGAAPSVVNVAGCLVNVIINTSLVKYGGDDAVGAAGIFTTVTQLVVMIVLGICQGMQPIVGYNYGAGKLNRSVRAFWLATAAATALCTVATVVGLCVPEALARAFTHHPTLIEVTKTCLTTAMLAFPVVGFQIVATNYFQSIGAAGKSFLLGLVRQVIFLIPLLVTLPTHFGLRGIWLSFPGSDLCATVVTAMLIWWQLRQLRQLQPVPSSGTPR